MPTPETKLEYRLRKLTADERLTLCDRLKVTERTLFNWMNRPRSISIEQLETICDYLEHVDGQEYDRMRMLEPVEASATKTATAA